MIEIENVYKEYRQKKKAPIRVLGPVSLSIGDGEVVALLGHNGSGKSTLMKCLCGVIKPTTGRVMTDGKDAFLHRKYFTHHMGVVFNQKPSFIVDLTVEDNMRYFQAIYQIPSEEFGKNLAYMDDFLHIADLMEKPYRKLSFGERVKCEIASVLLHRPQYIYLDEPTIGLDYAAKKGLYDLLGKQKKNGATMVITTHEVDYIEGICDRAVILKKGEVRYDGSARGVTAQVDAKKKLSVEYSGIKDAHVVRQLQCFVPDGLSGMENGNARNTQNFYYETEQEKDMLMRQILQGYQVKRLEVEKVTVREVLEHVLKEGN